jgi:hypothetical protein
MASQSVSKSSALSCQLLVAWYKDRHWYKKSDWYFERIIDAETGEVIHECEEPLSDHCEQGSAKKTNKNT